MSILRINLASRLAANGNFWSRLQCLVDDAQEKFPLAANLDARLILKIDMYAEVCLE
jgi:hypothetical protein